ncbi:MAG: ABC transporter ATP-binding protein [bacterium]
MANIIVEDLHKSFVKEDGSMEEVLNGVTFTANHEEFVCLLGPSGCGKTTILNIIAGLIADYSGKLLLSKEKFNEKVRIGYVFQTPRLLNWKTVQDNIIFALEAVGIQQKQRKKIATEYLNLAGLADSTSKYPLFCSEGEKARVAIARALAIDPDILLMDEPFSHLDEITARKMRTELLKIWSEKRKTVVFVTHNALEAVYLADKIYILSQKPTVTIGEVRIDLMRPRILEDIRLLEYQKEVLRRIGI